MEIDANNSVAIQHFLASAEDQDWSWVAFDLPLSGQIDHLHGFESAGEAVDFCAGSNIRFDYDEPGFIKPNFLYMPIDSLKRAILQHPNVQMALTSPDQLIAQLAAQNVQVLESMGTETLMPLIQTGAVFPAQFDLQIFPEEEVDRFIVVAHHHSGNHDYELGHSVKIMDSFDSIDQAEQYFAGLTKQYHDNTDKNDYQLIGLYRQQDYNFDLEATPEKYSGVTLKTAYYQFDSDLRANVWQVENNLNLDRPVNIKHFIYAQYDDKTGHFKLLNDHLKETRLENIKTSTYPSYFINEKLTIKQLEIMNEQSYDYVKDQLKYLGFGEEIAKPLREKMAEGLNEFTLNHSKDFGKDKTESVLHFSKGDDLQKDLTFFNRFDMTLKQEGKEDLTQNFFVGQKYNYTLQERYNMMDGRSVYREQPKVEPKEVNGETKMVPTGETYKAWKGLNFKESDERGNFLPKTMFWRHDKEIMKYPLKDVTEPYDRNRLLASMEKGNKANVTILRGNDEIKATVAANPKMQRFDFYDANGQTLFVKQVEKQKLSKSETQGQSQQQNTDKAEKQENTQQQSTAKDKAETVGHGEQQKPGNPDNLTQAPQQHEQSGQKESQKTDVADEQKNNNAQRKRQGVKM